MRHLPVDDRLRPLGRLAAGRCPFEDEKAVANGSERIAKLVREDGQEFVLATFRLASFLGLLALADVADGVDAPPQLAARTTKGGRSHVHGDIGVVFPALA